jgi:RNA polymerase sigma-B factor
MPISPSDRELILRHRVGDKRAREAFIERHLPVARRLALRYRGAGEPIEDLIQVASLGLLKAADRWDPDHGAPFPSFALPTILGELRHYFRDATWMVRPPRELLELTVAVQRARERLYARCGREPAVGELAVALGRTPAAIAEALQACNSCWTCSLDGPPDDEAGDDATIGAQLGGEEGGFGRAEARATLEPLLAVLDRRARKVLRLVYDADLTQAQVAEHIGCSQVHVSRIVRGSLAKLRLWAAA